MGVLAGGGVYYVAQCVSTFQLTSFLFIDRREANPLSIDAA